MAETLEQPMKLYLACLQNVMNREDNTVTKDQIARIITKFAHESRDLKMLNAEVQKMPEIPKLVFKLLVDGVGGFR
jgi:hypothetical protein